MFSTLPPFYSSSSSMTQGMHLPVSQSKSRTSVFVKFSIGLHGRVAKIEALMHTGASGNHLWNSSMYSPEFFKFSSGSHVNMGAMCITNPGAEITNTQKGSGGWAQGPSGNSES